MPLLVRLPRRHGYKATYPGVLNVLDRKETAVQRQLRRSGLAGYEPLTQATLLSIAETAPAESTFLDVGAHIGIYSAQLLATFEAHNGLKVVAFEPTPTTAQLCRGLANANGLTLEVVEAAVGEVPGETDLYLSSKAETSNSLNSAHRHHAGIVRVNVLTVDQFVAQRRLTPHLLKVDVETFEAQVLAGAMATVERHRPWMVVEMLPSGIGGAMDDVVKQLEILDYALYPISPETPWPAVEAGSYANYVNRVCRDWLFAPRPLDPDFYRLYRGWLRGILACDERMNLELPSGERIPTRWSKPSGAFSASLRMHPLSTRLERLAARALPRINTR